MYLYELAIELDRRSAEVVDAAAALGFGALTASSTLDASQVHHLRARLGAPGGAPGGAPAPMPGPATFAPPSAADLAPPPPAPFAPTSAPMPAPPGPAPAPPGPAAFTPPVSFVPAGAPVSPPPPPPAPPAGPGGRSSGSGRGVGPGGFSRPQLAALGTVVVLVIGLFGYMVATSGPDEARERAIAEGELGDDGLEATRATTSTLATTTTEATTTTVAQDLTVPVDVAVFCDGGRSLVAFHLRISAAIIDEDLDNLRQVAGGERPAWDGALDQVSVGGPPALVDEVERYQAGVGRWLDALAAGASLVDAQAQAGDVEFLRALNAGDEFIRQVGFYCQ